MQNVRKCRTVFTRFGQDAALLVDHLDQDGFHLVERLAD